MPCGSFLFSATLAAGAYDITVNGADFNFSTDNSSLTGLPPWYELYSSVRF